MRIPFDKIYIISYVKNIDKQYKTKELLDSWNISNYEYIYGIDTNGLIDIFNYKDIEFFTTNKDDEFTYNVGHISCGIAHFTAIQHAWYSNYNNCLIIEDDALFCDDQDYIEYCFNNMPSDAGSCRFGLTWRPDELSDYNCFWIKNEMYVGTQCYSINTREAMNEYITKYTQKFVESDENWLLENVNVYQLRNLIAKDPYSCLKIGK